MGELSQAEWTAMGAVESPVPWRLLTIKEQEIVEANWLAARDYYTARGPNSYWANAALDYKRWLEESEKLGQEAAAESASHAETIARAEQLIDDGRERERALEETLSRLLNASRNIMPYEKKGPVNELIEAEAHADKVLAASQPKVLGRNARSYRHIGCDDARPDHGPGEPSEDAERPDAEAERYLRWIWRTCRRNLDGEKSATYLGILNFIERHRPDVAARIAAEEAARLAEIRGTEWVGESNG